MIFGFSAAVAGGFLLTMLQNATRERTLHGTPLLVLAALWVLARLMPWLGDSTPLLTAVPDILFGLLLTIALALPVARTRQWAQAGLVSKVALLTLANGVFYAAAYGSLPAQAMPLSLYAGLYLLVALMLSMGRRVIPFFIRSGLQRDGCPFEPTNRRWVDHSSLGLFVIFVVSHLSLLINHHSWAQWSLALSAFALCVVHAVRLRGWHHRALWRQPLLWSLYCAYGFIVLGFVLILPYLWGSATLWIALHAFACGGIGLMSAGMMARVSLGHTGGNIFAPPAGVSIVFVLIIAGALLRTLGVWMMPLWTDHAIFWAQMFWILAFSLLLLRYAPMLWRAMR